MRRCACLLLLFALLVSCGGGDGLCHRLPGTEFRSEERISSVLGPDGVEPSHEYVGFSDSEADWLYGDVVEVGEYECSRDRVASHEGLFVADVVEEAGRLVLDRGGTRYVQQ